MIALFETIIGVITCMMLHETGIKTKWPFYLAVWVILLSYILLYMFRAFIYVDSQYFDLTNGNLNV
jgi:hypothetical protein